MHLLRAGLDIFVQAVHSLNSQFSSFIDNDGPSECSAASFIFPTSLRFQ